MTNDATVLLVDDHAMLRKGLRVLLDAEEDLRVVGEAGDGEAAVERARELTPDVVVMDITMPGVSGVDATRAILAEAPHTKVVALSIHAGKRFVESMLQAGAAGYILKENAPEELIQAIRAVMRGEGYLSPAITGIVLSGYRAGAGSEEAVAREAGLDSQETRLLEMTTTGVPNDELATALGISPEAAADAQRRLMKKLGVGSTDELAEFVRNRSELSQPGMGEPRPSSNGGEEIIRTKLHRPILSEGHLTRPGLLARLDRGRQLPVTLVSAAAGYGKTSLLA